MRRLVGVGGLLQAVSGGIAGREMASTGGPGRGDPDNRLTAPAGGATAAAVGRFPPPARLFHATRRRLARDLAMRRCLVEALKALL